jgi:hypothetical protein
MISPFRVYVAGARSEASRARRVFDALESLGCVVLEKWTEDPRADQDAWQDGDAVEIVDRQLEEIGQADCFWLLVPEPPHSSRGCWVELGYASSESSANLGIIASGPWKQTIFSSLCHRRFPSDHEALLFINDHLEERKKAARVKVV